ncbi:hypothetical protein LOZ66_001102 [Ophidiomyces ophidiicola]|nr:hypothetical protein LOZ66_001102 [Ophidiomyces ophidiicola]
MPPAQIHLLEKLFTWPTSDSLEDKWRRRNEGVEAVKQYCDFLEGGSLVGRPKQKAPGDEISSEGVETKPERKDLSSASSWRQKLQTAEESIKSAPKPKICFQFRKEIY